MPIVVTRMWTAPYSDSSPTITLWHIETGSGQRLSHQRATSRQPFSDRNSQTGRIGHRL